MTLKSLFSLKRSHRPAFSSGHVTFRERLTEDPYLGWAIVISASILAALILILIALQLFLLVDSGRIAAPAAPAGQDRIAFDAAALDQVISDFQVRASTTAALEDSYGGPSDPSL